MTKPPVNSRRLADMTIEPPSSTWVPPPREDRDRQDTTINLLGDDRVQSRMEFDTRRQLVDFALVHQTFDGGSWWDVCRVDCCHGEVHVHWYDPEGRQTSREVVRPINTAEDVRLGWDEASELVYGGWEHHQRRWRNGGS